MISPLQRSKRKKVSMSRRQHQGDGRRPPRHRDELTPEETKEKRLGESLESLRARPLRGKGPSMLGMTRDRRLNYETCRAPTG